MKILPHLSSDLNSARAWLAIPEAARLAQLQAAASHCPHRLVASNTTLSARAYEQHIQSHGEIPTRLNASHDFFNALMWHRYPRSKALLNQYHVLDAVQGNRSRLRDGLTLLDESGLLIWTEQHILEELRPLHQSHSWNSLFVVQRNRWKSQIQVHLFGHGALDTCLTGTHAQFTLKALWLPKLSDHLDDDLTTWLSGHTDEKLPQYFLPLPFVALTELVGEANPALYQNQSVFRPKSNKKACL